MIYIYKIKGINYIGSTNNIKKRCWGHKSDCWNENSRGYNCLVYEYIREKKMKIELEILGVYKRKCNKRIKLLVEQYYINKYDSKNNGFNTVNSFSNKEKIKQRVKKYYEEHKEERKIKFKKYYEKNKDIISKKEKEYREKNKDKISKREKEYRKKNKDKISQREKIKINCPTCNSLVIKKTLKRHQRSLKCKSFQVAV